MQGAEAILRALLSNGGAERADVIQDPDFKNLHDSQLFTEIMNLGN